MMMKIKELFKKFNSKSNIKLLLLFSIIGFIVLTTFTNVGLDPNNFDFYKWFTSTIITIAISIAGMLLGEVLASDSLKSKVNGLYQRTLEKYIIISIKIQSIIMYFNDFLLWFKEKETFIKQVNFLINHDIKEAKDIVKYLSIEQLDELKLHPIELENGVIVRKKSEEQINAIRKVLEGKITIKSSSTSYYLNAFENHTECSILEEGRIRQKNINNYKKDARTSKLVYSICVSIVFATLTVQELVNYNMVVALTNLAIRLCTFLSCLYCGWSTESYEIKELAKIIENKIKILDIFNTSYTTGEFKPSEYEDLARKEYEEYMKEGEGQVENINRVATNSVTE